MPRPDLNLLVALDVLLAEGSVTAAARRLRLSPSAMSRTLARLRRATGDPLFVRAGRGLVPTPRALELRGTVSQLVEGAEAVLRPATAIDPRRLDRTFSLRASDGFVENFGPELISRVAEEAPGVRLRFVQKIDRSSSPLRDGSIDLETGVLGPTKAPELRVQALFQDRFVGVVRSGHPWVRKEMTPALYAGGLHILVSRRGLDRGPIDDALAALGLERRIKTIVGGFAAALALARNSDLVASVPEHHSGTLHRGMYSFPLPVPLHGITVSLFWHPRSGSDPAHAWFRRLVRDVCAGPPGRRGIGSDGASDA